MPKAKLSNTWIKNKKSSAREETIFDEASGLILRVFPSGRKNFGWRHADKFRQGSLSRVSYGDYPNRTLDEARKIHAEVRSARGNGIDIKNPEVLNKLIRSIVLQATRQHWLVENQMHWVLDVAFDEDRCRARESYAAENLAVTRQVTLNLLKLDTSVKAGIKNKRKTCGWDENYMMKALELINS